MLSHYGLIKVIRVKTYTECTIRLAGVGESGYPLSRSGDRFYDPFFNHVIKGVLNLFPVLNGGLLLGVLDWENIRVCPDGIGPSVPFFDPSLLDSVPME